MRTTHHPNQILVSPSRPLRCLRHHVWMAVCDDCRAARTAQARREPETPTAAR